VRYEVECVLTTQSLAGEGSKALGDCALELALGKDKGILLGELLDLESGHGLLQSVLNVTLVVTLELHGDVGLVEGTLDLVDVGLELLLGLDDLLVLAILILELLGLSDHALNISGRETTSSVGDGDVGLATSGLVHGGDLEDTVGVQLEGALKLGGTAGHGGNARELELAEQVVITGHGTLTLVDGELDGGLTILGGGEGLLLDGGDGSVTGNNDGHDTTLHLNSEGEGNDIQEQKILGLGVTGLVGQDGGLDGGTVGDSLIGVDGLVQLLSVEELGKKSLDLGDTGGTTDQDDLIDLLLGELGILKDLLDGLNGVVEVNRVDLLETGTGDVGLEVNTLEEGVDLNGGLGQRGQGALGTLASGTKTTHGTVVTGDVLLVLALELLLEVLQEGLIEILTSQVSVTSGGLDGEDTSGDGKEGNIEGSTTQIEDENVLLLGLLGVQTVGDGGSGGLVDDT